MIERLRDLAHMNGVATEFWDWSGQHRKTPKSTLLRVLASLGLPVDEDTDAEGVERAIIWTDDQVWTHAVPECTVTREGDYCEVQIHVPHGSPVHVWVETEDGGGVDCTQVDKWVEPRWVDGQLTGRAAFALPSLPLGYHKIGASISGGEPIYGHLIVVPHRLEPAQLAGGKRFWGVNVQAYSVLSEGSWGVGDAEDLADLTAICAKSGADFVLVNPLHAVSPVAPIEDSPYLPVSRTWLNVMYIRPERIPEYASAPEEDRLAIEALRMKAVSAPPNRGGDINRDASWEAKVAALRIIFGRPRSVHREAEFQAFINEGGSFLHSFALWCALVEQEGTLLFDAYEAVADPERVLFFQWVQWVAAQQLSEPNVVAKRLGMSIGVMSDLAVGVHPQGAAFWGEKHEYAEGMSVGAPPDMYAQQGQDWSQPPWNPRALASLGFEPFVKVVRAALNLSSALRIDHIIGLFRLWWIPTGESPMQGTYVNFDYEAMIGVLLLEAHRSGALLIGEDLGTVEPWVRQYLAERGILGTSVLWFEKDWDGKPLPPWKYRQGVLATVNTHDLPPTAGYMAGIQTKLRHELGLLEQPLDEVLASDAAEQAAMRARLREYGLLQSEPGSVEPRGEVIEALHRYIARTPSELVAVALVDGVGEEKPQNLPGTDQEYPNWRIQLSDDEGNPIWLEDLEGREDLQRLFALMREEMG